jgi:hypothetical protein
MATNKHILRAFETFADFKANAEDKQSAFLSDEQKSQIFKNPNDGLYYIYDPNRTYDSGTSTYAYKNLSCGELRAYSDIYTNEYFYRNGDTTSYRRMQTNSMLDVVGNTAMIDMQANYARAHTMSFNHGKQDTNFVFNGLTNTTAFLCGSYGNFCIGQDVAKYDGQRVISALGAISPSIRDTGIGKMYYNSAQEGWYTFDSVHGAIPRTLYAGYNSVTIANTTNVVAFFTYTFPANFFKANKTFSIVVQGDYSTKNPSPGNFRTEIYLGANAIGTKTHVMDNSVTNLFWKIEGTFTCISTGSSGTTIGESIFLHCYNDGSTDTMHGGDMSTVSAVVTDTTIPLTLSVRGNWYTADAANSIVSKNVILTVHN